MRIHIRRLVMLSLYLVMAAYVAACLPPPMGVPCGDMWCPAGQKCGPDVGLQQQVCVTEGACGNGILDVGEDCDCGNGIVMPLDKENCASQQNSDTGGWCSSQCKRRCGNGHVDEDEMCDPGVPVAADCVVRNHDFGRPGCSASCNAITVDSCGDWGWRPVDTGMSQTFNAIWGSQPHDIWASGNDMVLHYDGAAWHAENVRPFFDMWGSGPGDIFGLTVRGEPDRQRWAIWHYDGSRWQQAHASNDDRLLAIWGSESADQSREVFVLTDKRVPELATTGAASPDSGRFVILRCGGMSPCEDETDWMEMTTGATRQPRAIWGTGAQDFFIAGDQGMIQRYHPPRSGQPADWEDMSQSEAVDLAGIWGDDSDNVYAIGSGGLLLHYDGQSWMKPRSPGLEGIDFSDLSSIWGSGANDIFVVGSENLVLHFDGSSWQRMPHDTRSSFPSHVWGTGPGDVYAFSLGAAMVHYDGTDLQQMEYPDQVPPADRPTLQGVWFNQNGGVYSLGKNAPGTDSSIVSYDGVSWKLLPLASLGRCLNTQDIVGVWGCSSKDVCLIDGEGATAIYGPSSQGCLARNWPARGSSVVAVWANGAKDMYAIGEHGVVMHSLAPFLFWSPMNSGTTSSLRAIWGSGPADIWAVGEGGTVIHYNGKGNAWEKLEAGSSATWAGVWASGPHDVYVVAETSATGASTLIKHFDGKDWTAMETPMESGPPRPIRAVWGSGRNDVYAVGDGGRLLHNDGKGWLPMRSGEPVDFLGIAGDPAGRTRFIVGEQGTILRMTSPQ